MIYHKPVLLEESVNGLNINPTGVYADLTFGGGGHSRLILEGLGKKGKLLVFDQDMDARKNAPEDDRLIFIHSNFRYLKNFIRYYNTGKADGIIADLGISSHQIDEPDRGFMHREDSVLDMRMNKSAKLTAEMVVNEYSKQELARIFRLYGELPGAGKFSHLIVKAREENKLKTTAQLIEIIEPVLPQKQRNKFLSMLFQAIRIEVNDELGALVDLLNQIPEVLNEKGRLVILSYHSLEDRLVKNYIRTGNVEGNLEKDFYGNIIAPMKAINKKVLVPDENEIQGNSRARSAKLRIAEML
jgi:16S rRNA (cytosine1402-N4)-methyltransferase